MTDNQAKTIFISSLEHSAELHCANLVRTVNSLRRQSLLMEKPTADIKKSRTPATICWVGFGGSDLANASCSLLEQTVKRASMLYNVFSQIGYYRKLIQTAKQYFKRHRPDLVIVCDSPAFNFHIARLAKKLGIPVLFYVAPQLWAWAPWRIGKLRRYCDRLACILPFEEKWFQSRGVKAEFVGNPLLDNLPGPVSANVKDYRTYEPNCAKIALLPGSRKAEIQSLWPAMQEIGKLIRERFGGVKFVAVAADADKLGMLKSLAINDLDVEYRTSGLVEAAMECDFALVASGSASLQVAAAGCPMIVMYQSNKMLWHLLGRWIVRLKHLSLVNILAGREVAAEFMPYFKSIEPIVRKSLEILDDREILARQSRELVKVVEPMAKGCAAEKTAKIVFEMLNIA